MALRKVTIQIEELQYQRLRQESFDKHIPISELIRIHLEESKMPLAYARFVPSNAEPSNIAMYSDGNNKSLPINPIPDDGIDVAIEGIPHNKPQALQDEDYPEPEEIADARETDRCQAPNTNCKNEGYLYRVTFMTDEGEKKKDYFLCDVHVKKTRDSGQEVSEI